MVYIATATDDSLVTYSLSGADADAFSIDPATGVVTLTAQPDYEVQDSYSFDIVATDEVGNASEAQTVTLDINNIDEVAPLFAENSAQAFVTDNSVLIR